jgi:hypothetical protein
VSLRHVRNLVGNGACPVSVGREATVGRANFRQREVTSLIKGAAAAGMALGRFGVQRIDGGSTLMPTGAFRRFVEAGAS